jgi:hypothetical protein
MIAKHCVLPLMLEELTKGWQFTTILIVKINCDSAMVGLW